MHAWCNRGPASATRQQVDIPVAGGRASGL